MKSLTVVLTSVRYIPAPACKCALHTGARMQMRTAKPRLYYGVKGWDHAPG